MTRDILAWGFLSALVVWPLVWGLISQRRLPYGVAQSILYFTALIIVRCLWRLRVRRPLSVPPGQGAVLISNHRSSVDPFFLQANGIRKIHWMVAREYCEYWAFRWFLKACEVIPVGRGGIDTAATKMSIRLAREGGLVGMFPEGRINMSEDFMLPGRPGAVLVALKARVPIIPCYVQGSPYGGSAWSPFFRRARVELTCGDPIDLSPYYDRADENGVVADLMLGCLTEIARLARVDFQPQLAGRRWKPSEQELEADLHAFTARAR